MSLPSNCYSDSSNNKAICISKSTNDITCENNKYNNSKKGNIIISDYYENIKNNWSCNNSVYNCNNTQYNNCINTININGNNCVKLSNFAPYNAICIESESKNLTEFTSNDNLSWQSK
jgi:hypothetical protein